MFVTTVGVTIQNKNVPHLVVEKSTHLVYFHFCDGKYLNICAHNNVHIFVCSIQPLLLSSSVTQFLSFNVCDWISTPFPSSPANDAQLALPMIALPLRFHFFFLDGVTFKTFPHLLRTISSSKSSSKREYYFSFVTPELLLSIFRHFQ